MIDDGIPSDHEIIKHLRSALAEAMDALEPFAKEADDYDGEGDDREGDNVGLWIGTRKYNIGHANFCLGNLRRARAILAKHKDSTHDK